MPGRNPSSTGSSCSAPSTEYLYGSAPPDAATVIDPSLASQALACCTASTESVSEDVAQSNGSLISLSVQATTMAVKQTIHRKILMMTIMRNVGASALSSEFFSD